MIGEALSKHLSCIGELSKDDAAGLLRIKGEVRAFPKSKDILSAGDVPHFSVVVLNGLLCRHSWKRDGSRQIHSFYIPTDAPSLETLHIDYLDNNLGAVVQSTIGVVPPFRDVPPDGGTPESARTPLARNVGAGCRFPRMAGAQQHSSRAVGDGPPLLRDLRAC